MSFKERLGKEWLFWDGGFGSILQEWGLKAGEKAITYETNSFVSPFIVHS